MAYYARTFDGLLLAEKSLTRKAFRLSNNPDRYISFEKMVKSTSEISARIGCNTQDITVHIFEVCQRALEETDICKSLPWKTRQGNG